MSIIGVDLGFRKIGLARSAGSLAEPLVVIGVRNRTEALEQIAKIARQEQAETIVLGLPEGPLKEVVIQFGKSLKNKLAVAIHYWDETLSSQNAAILLKQSGRNIKYRRNQEDAIAAAVILQSFLDAQK